MKFFRHGIDPSANTQDEGNARALGRPLRILSLEDSELDYQLMLGRLEKDGFEVESQRVDQEQAFRSALGSGSYDIILADYVLPSFNGVQALAIAAELAPQTPFIFVSGTLGEELAVQMLREGATDYIVKQRLEPLGRAIERAIGEQRERSLRREAELAVREREKMLGTIYSQISVGIAVTDLAGRFLSVSPYYCRMLGRTREELLDGTMMSVTHTDDLPGNMEKFRKLSQEGGSFEIEKRYLRPDGSTIWVHNSIAALLDENSEIYAIVAIATDITERRKAEEALRRIHEKLEQRVAERTRELARSKAFLRTIMDTVADPIFVKDRQHCWIEGNRAFWALFGKPESEMRGKTDYDVFPAEQAAVFWEGDEKVFSEWEPSDNEETILLPDGRQRLIHTRKTPFTLADGTPGLVGIIHDITEQRAMEEEHRRLRSEQRFRELADSINQMIWVTRPDGYHEYFNRRWYEYTGLPEGATDGDGWNGIFHPEDRSRAWSRWNHSLETGEPYEIEYRLRRADGAFRWVLGRAEPVRDEAGAILKWYGTCTDIQELFDARQRAEEASLAKSEFLANMSHEIRTPLNAVVGIASLLERGGLPPEKLPHFTRTLRTSAESLLELINDLLDISKIEQRNFELADETFPLMELFNDVGEMLNVRAREKGVAFLMDTAKMGGLSYRGDRTRLRQVLVNIVGNAIKFTHDGSVRFQVRRVVPRNGDAALLRILVSDTGIGIPAEARQTIFEKFGRAMNVGNIPGTGLGLSITRHLVEMMGGTIEVSSTVGEGTSVEILLPDRFVREEEGIMASPSPIRPPLPAGKRVLLVEDLTANILVARAIIEGMGVACDVAHDGREALEKMKSGRYHLVLMDVNMPELDGLAATRLWRQWEDRENITDGLPIVGMTAHALLGDRERCLEAGMNDYLSKPITAEALQEKIEMFFLAEERELHEPNTVRK